jgi:polysaccharide export outer membrane protein
MKLFFFLLTIFILLSGCTSQKELTYLQDIDEGGVENFFELDRPEYKIQKQDILYIKFTTLNEEINNVLNSTSSDRAYMMFQNESNLFINGYNVSDSGTVIIPLIGEVKVEGKTVEDAQRSIQKESLGHLKESTVTVKLLSFKFSVLGEVTRPGTYKNFNNQLTVLEAISMAGDISDYGDREQVLVLRPQENGTKTFRINLKSKDILTSEAFFLLPNDVVIVEPIGSKIIQLNIPTISLILTTLFSTISTTLLILNFSK